MRTHPHLVHPRQQGYMSQQQQQQSSYMKQQKSGQDMQHHYGMQDAYGKTQKRPLGSGGSYLPQQRSFSSSEEDIRSTPEFEGEWCIFHMCRAI
jgi:hypothetical protein